MANRVVVNICGEEYTFIAEESASYMQRVGAYVGDKMQEVLSGTKVGRTDAAVVHKSEGGFITRTFYSQNQHDPSGCVFGAFRQKIIAVQQ